MINSQATGGIIIASSILVSRALAPVELAIANWKGFVQARQAWARLADLLEPLPPVAPTALPLPRPSSRLDVEAVASPRPAAAARGPGHLLRAPGGAGARRHRA